jgi:hypothetical protein
MPVFQGHSLDAAHDLCDRRPGTDGAEAHAANARVSTAASGEWPTWLQKGRQKAVR